MFEIQNHRLQIKQRCLQSHYFVLAGSCLRIFVEIHAIQSKAQRSQFWGK